MDPGRVIRMTPHMQDSAVATALKGAQAMPVAGAPVLVGFRNERGELYRYAVLDGPIQMRYLKHRLVQLQLLSDVDDSNGILAVVGRSDAGLLRALAASHA